MCNLLQEPDSRTSRRFRKQSCHHLWYALKTLRRATSPIARKGRRVASHCAFPMICGSGGLKSHLAKAAGAEPAGQMRDEKTESFAIDDRFGQLKRVQPDHNQTRILRVPPAPWCSGARDWEGERGKMNGTCRGEQVEQDRMKQKLWKL